MNKKIIGIVVIATILHSVTGWCRDFSFSERSQNASVTDKLEKITYIGEKSEPAENVQALLVLRSAEYAKFKNKPYFKMYTNLKAVVYKTPTYLPAVTTYNGYSAAYCYIQVLDKREDSAFDTEVELNKNSNNYKNSYKD